MISNRLAYVALAVADPAATAAAFERDFGLPRGEAALGKGRVPVLGIGRSALVLCPLGDPFVEGQQRPGMHHIALAVADPDEAARSAREEGVPTLPEGVTWGLGGGERILLAPEATCGVRVALSTPLDTPGDGSSSSSSAGGPVERLDHLGVACLDNREAIEVFVNRLGLPLESTQTDVETAIAYESFTSDKYGVVHHTRAPEVVGGLRAAFVSVGDCELEFLQELDGHGDPRVRGGAAGTTRQDYGAIATFAAKRGPGLHHLALKVADIDGMLARLRAAGHAVIDAMGRPGGRRSRIGFIHPRSLGGVLLHLVQRDART